MAGFLSAIRDGLKKSRDALSRELKMVLGGGTLTEEMLECIPGDCGSDEALEAEALSSAISAYLASCAEEQRNIFVRRYWFFDPVADIARRYGCSQSKVKTALFRMREGLRKHLEKEGYSL